MQSVSSGIAAPSPTNAQPNTPLPDGLKYFLLTPADQYVPEPTNPFKVTDPTGSAFQGRHNIKEKLKKSPFTQTSKACRRVGRNRSLAMEVSKPKEVDVERIVGRYNMQWLKKNFLNEKSHPVEFLKSFLLITEKN